MAKALVDLNVSEFKHETDSAWFVTIEGKDVWLAKSQCEFDIEDGVVTMPEWLAVEKELV